MGLGPGCPGAEGQPARAWSGLADDAAAEADGDRMGPRAGRELRQEMPDVALDRLLGEEEPLADLAVHEAVGDELEHLDLTRGEALMWFFGQPATANAVITML